jgi:hypothetical protein
MAPTADEFLTAGKRMLDTMNGEEEKVEIVWITIVSYQWLLSLPHQQLLLPHPQRHLKRSIVRM